MSRLPPPAHTQDRGKRLDPPARWQLPDLIDLEHFIERDEQALLEDPKARTALVERDRRLYLGKIAPALTAAEPHTLAHRRASLLLWLGARRFQGSAPGGALLPGAAFAFAQRAIALGLALTGLLAGSSAASFLLRYDGVRPVNVAWYLFVLVIPQILLVAAAIGTWIGPGHRRDVPFGRRLGLPGRLIRPLLERLAGRIQAQRPGAVRATQSVEGGAASAQGRLRARLALYGGLSYLPVLVTVQVFGIAFNIGVIVTTLSLIWFSDLAFGWGTTLTVSPETIHRLVQGLALPWSWLFGEGVGYPSLHEIAGSRINLKDPLRFLDAADLRSWRWFLPLAVCAYGLLPRALLLAASSLAQRRLLQGLPFTHASVQGLYARLISPHLEIGRTPATQGVEMPIPEPMLPRTRRLGEPQGPADREAGPISVGAQNETAESASQTLPRPPSKAIPQATPPRPTAAAPEPPAVLSTPAPDEGPQPTPPPSATRASRIAADSCLLLVHVDVDDLLETEDRPRLARLLLGLSGWRVTRWTPFGFGTAMTEAALKLVSNQNWESPPGRVALVMDGSQPPIVETLRLLRELRSAAGPQAQLLVALVGDPAEHDPLPPVRPFDLADWRRKIEAMGDPYLRLAQLTPSDFDPAQGSEADTAEEPRDGL